MKAFDVRNKAVIFQSIIWVPAILVVSIVKEKKFAIEMVAFLESVSLIYS